MVWAPHHVPHVRTPGDRVLRGLAAGAGPGIEVERPAPDTHEGACLIELKLLEPNDIDPVAGEQAGGPAHARPPRRHLRLRTTRCGVTAAEDVEGADLELERGTIGGWGPGRRGERRGVTQPGERRRFRHRQRCSGWRGLDGVRGELRTIGRGSHRRTKDEEQGGDDACRRESHRAALPSHPCKISRTLSPS